MGVKLVGEGGAEAEGFSVRPTPSALHDELEPCWLCEIVPEIEPGERQLLNNSPLVPIAPFPQGLF